MHPKNSRYRSKPKLLDRVGASMRVRDYSPRTIQAYTHWIKRFILFHNKTHPAQMGEKEITTFLTDLAVKQKVSPSTQNQALQALIYLYKNVLNKPLGWVNIPRSRRSPHIPMVYSRREVKEILSHTDDVYRLILQLVYGAGLRLSECLRLRIKDVDFEQSHIVVRDGKGHKDRVTVLPERLMAPLKKQIERVRLRHEKDQADGFGVTVLPYALSKKYPAAANELGWQYVFMAKGLLHDKKGNTKRRYHIHSSSVQKRF
ncbi:MAG: integron integrase, partial [Candidatus Heimdallarchaeota archaeon]